MNTLQIHDALIEQCDAHEAIGIPLELTLIQGGIFAGLPEEEQSAWPGHFMRALRGRDLSMAWPRFALWLLADESSPIYKPAHSNVVKEAVDRAVLFYKEWCKTGVRPSDARWEEAKTTAVAAVRSTSDALSTVLRWGSMADVERWSARVEAAEAVEATADAAQDPSRSESAVWSAVAVTHADWWLAVKAWRTMRDKLLEIMRACPEMKP